MMNLSAALAGARQPGGTSPRETLDEWRARKAREHAEVRAQLIAEDRARQLAVLRRDSELGARFASRTFANWRLSPTTEEALEAAKAVAADPKRGLWLYGTVGSGKTHLGASIANDALDHAIPAVFKTGVGVLERLRSSYEHNGNIRENERNIIAQYAAVDVLVLDDLGKERFTAWSAEKFYELINCRYEKDKPIIVTSNLAPTDLAAHWTARDMDPAMGDSLVRRLIEMAGAVVLMGEPA